MVYQVATTWQPSIVEYSIGLDKCSVSVEDNGNQTSQHAQSYIPMPDNEYNALLNSME